MKITDDDVMRALAMLALEGEATLLDPDAPDCSKLLLTFLRDHLQFLVDRDGVRPQPPPPRMQTLDTWGPFPDGYTIVNRTALRLGGRIDAKTSAPALPGVSYLPATFSGVYFGDDLQAEILRGDVTVYPPGVTVPKAALKFAPDVWALRLQLAPSAKYARECATKLKGTQHALNAESKATQMEGNEARRAEQSKAPARGQPAPMQTNSFGVPTVQGGGLTVPSPAVAQNAGPAITGLVPRATNSFGAPTVQGGKAN